MWLSTDGKIVLESLKIEQENLGQDKNDINKLPALNPGVKMEVFTISNATKLLYETDES